MPAASHQPVARLGGLWATGLLDLSHDPGVLEGAGRWAVVVPYDGRPTFARFANWQPQAPDGVAAAAWQGPQVSAWTSSMDEAAYVAAVQHTREAIARGTIYQANICRVLRARIPDPTRASMAGLHALLEQRNPAPYGGFVHLPEAGIDLATASPELFLERTQDVLRTRPIKGTGSRIEDLQEKDRAENVMIVDLMRHDLARVCVAGSVTVPDLLRIEPHPGLIHLVSTVQGHLTPSATWADILGATFPPGSVTGAPKSTALPLIDDCEPGSRGPYCGAIGWIDVGQHRGTLAVAIRTFWRDGDVLCFGTGAGITWGSDPAAEWAETELKARHLINVASGTWPEPAGVAGLGG